MKQYHSHQYIADKIRKTKPIMAFQREADFAEWKVKCKEKLEELLGLPFELCADMFVITEEKDTKLYRQICFEFQSEEGYFVPCDLLIPIDAKEPFPVAICLQGHSSGKNISMGIKQYDSDTESMMKGRDFAIQAVQEGFCAVVLDQRYMGVAGHNANGQPGCCTTNQALPALLIGRSAIGERVWDVMRLIDVMEKYLTDYIDKDKIMCLGNSGGGTTTFYAAALDERIHMAIPSCAVCTFEDSIVDIHHCCCNYAPGIRKYFNMGDIGCLIAPRRLVVVCGIHDEIFPLKGVEKSYAVIESAYQENGSGENCRLVKGDGGHQFYPKDVWPIVNEWFGR